MEAARATSFKLAEGTTRSAYWFITYVIEPTGVPMLLSMKDPRTLQANIGFSTSALAYQCTECHGTPFASDRVLATSSKGRLLWDSSETETCGGLDRCTDTTPWKLSMWRTQLCTRVLKHLDLRAPSVTTLTRDVPMHQSPTDTPEVTTDDPLREHVGNGLDRTQQSSPSRNSNMLNTRRFSTGRLLGW